MWRFVITAKLKGGAWPEVRDILREGPPFDLEKTSLERHEVFLAEDEVVFLFEGPHADREAGRLLEGPGTLGRASRLASCLGGQLRLSEEVFSWERPATSEGLSFGPLPGPGDSDGGLGD
jgi:hypothetical protein